MCYRLKGLVQWNFSDKWHCVHVRGNIENVFTACKAHEESKWVNVQLINIMKTFGMGGNWDMYFPQDQNHATYWLGLRLGFTFTMILWVKRDIYKYCIHMPPPLHYSFRQGFYTLANCEIHGTNLTWPYPWPKSLVWVVLSNFGSMMNFNAYNFHVLWKTSIH